MMTILSVMWTTIFCASVGAWMMYGQLVAAHLLVLIGILFTGLTFRGTERVKASYRDYPREDGTARYDDVWGG
jgi:hypothetical protein